MLCPDLGLRTKDEFYNILTVVLRSVNSCNTVILLMLNWAVITAPLSPECVVRGSDKCTRTEYGTVHRFLIVDTLFLYKRIHKLM